MYVFRHNVTGKIVACVPASSESEAWDRLLGRNWQGDPPNIDVSYDDQSEYCADEDAT